MLRVGDDHRSVRELHLVARPPQHHVGRSHHPRRQAVITKQVITDSDVNVWSRDIKAWKVSTGGWFILDQVRGRDDWITYAIGVSPKGGVKSIEILECLDKYDGITQPEWLAQFYGRHHGNKFDDIQIISGSTLSSSQLAAGVKRIMSTLALVLDPPPG